MIKNKVVEPSHNIGEKAYISKFPQTRKSLPNRHKALRNVLFVTDSISIFNCLNSIECTEVKCVYKSKFETSKSRLIEGKESYLLVSESNPEQHQTYIKWCELNGAIYCDNSQMLRMLFKGNICTLQDALNPSKHNQKYKPIEVLLFLVGSNTRVKGYKDDMRLISVPHAIEVNFHQYLSENIPNRYGIIPSQQLGDIVSTYARLIIKSGAGTGKGHAMRRLDFTSNEGLNLASSLCKNITSNDFRFVIYIFPTNAITDQQAEDFKREIGQEYCIKLDKDTTREDIAIFDGMGARLILATIDSLHKIGRGDDDLLHKYIQDSCVIWDEYDTIIRQYDFRSEAIDRAYNIVSWAKKIIMCSATPELIFCQSKELHRHFGYTLVVGREQLTNKVNLKKMVYKGRETRLSALTFLHENYTQQGKTNLLKLDNKEDLLKAKRGLEKNGASVDMFFNGYKEAYKTKNENYTSISESGLLKNHVDWLGFTSILEMGVSLKFDCNSLTILDPENLCSSSLVQLAARPRFNKSTGVNKEIDVIVCQSSDNKKEYGGYKTGKYTDYFKRKVKIWKNHKESIQTIGGDSVRTGSDQEDIKLIIGSDSEHEINILGLIHVINKELDNISIEDLFKRAKRIDDRFIICEDIESKYSKLEAIKEETKALKIEKQTRKDKAIEAAKEDIITMCDLLAFKSKDTQKKIEIREIMGILYPDKPKALEFGAKHPTIIDCKFANRIVKRIVDLKRSCTSKGKKLENEKLLELVLNRDEYEIKSITSTINHSIRKGNVNKKTASVRDEIEHIKIKAIKQELSKVKRNVTAGRVKEFQTIDYYIKVMNKAIAKVKINDRRLNIKPYKQAKVKAILNDLCIIAKVVEKHKKKRTTKYKIVAAKTVEDALKSLEIDS